MATGAIFSEDIARRMRAMLEEWERERGRGPRPTPRRRLQPAGGQVKVFALDVDAEDNEGRKVLMPSNGENDSRFSYVCRSCRWYPEPSIGRWVIESDTAVDVYPSLLTGAYVQDEVFSAVQIGGRWYALGGHGILFELDGSLSAAGSANAHPCFWTGSSVLVDSSQTFTLRDMTSFVASAGSLSAGVRGYAAYVSKGAGASGSGAGDWIPVNAGCV